jgi:hypothetical protein
MTCIYGEDPGYRTITLSYPLGMGEVHNLHSVTYHVDNVETLAWENSIYTKDILKDKSKKDGNLKKLLNAYINLQFLINE